jgi:hypothetical protein
LRVYWQKVSALSARGIFKPSSVDKDNSDFGLEHSLGFWFLKMTYLTSPYQMNPFANGQALGLLRGGAGAARGGVPPHPRRGRARRPENRH